ncbi:MAG: hypothetical protein FWF78_06825 [Defluviitaleaceae bacterium]|nr:hypothetical protein [Defluviitaleaceae bacterium]
MKCPNCQKTFPAKGVKCPNCKIDTVLYMGTVRLSDKLFNQGLERLKSGDIFHGIEALTKSININKNNVPSRNLLGLALFELGHVGEALKHWIISQSLLLEENPAKSYIESVNKNARQLEKLNDAVGMYNQALGHIKNKSDDLAIIQLKKAVDINPRFVDALNLLTLCYLIQNDKDRAIHTAERVIAIDVFNPIALNYYAMINPGKSRLPRSMSKSQQPPKKGLYKSMDVDEKKQRNFHFAELLTFIIGVACTAAAFYFLLLPAMESSRETERQEAAAALSAEAISHQEQLTRMQEAQDDSQLEISRLNTDLDDVIANLVEQRRINDVNHAYFLYRGDELRAAVTILEGFDTAGLPPDIQQRVATILEGAYPQLATGYFNVGRNDFNPPRDSYMALVNLENALRFMDSESADYNRLLFMLGTLYYDESGRTDDAYDMLSALLERAPALPNFTGGERTAISNMMTGLEARR